MAENDPPLPTPDPGELLARAMHSDPRTGGDRWTPPAPEDLAALLPQYHIESLLGHGGMGAVYKGRQAALDRPVAIKLLPAELAADPQFIARFQREARTLARLQHPGIVAVHDFGQTSEGHLYFVMEFVDGTDLHRILHTPADDPAQPALTPAQVLELISQICDALHYAHSRGVIHRDIKPGNILVTTESRAKLADFGLARPVAEESAVLTGTHVVMGTAAYMAPEQQEGHADQRADIYALGVMLYEMLCGQRPSGAFDPPSQRVQVDVRLDGVVLKAMQQQPERRYQQVSEMKTDVDRIRTTPMERAEGRRQKAEGKTSRVRVAAGVAVACLALASAAGFFLWKKNDLSRVAHTENPRSQAELGNAPAGAASLRGGPLAVASEPSQSIAPLPPSPPAKQSFPPTTHSQAQLGNEGGNTDEAWVRKWNQPEDHPADGTTKLVAGWVVRRSDAIPGGRTLQASFQDGAIRGECRWASGESSASFWLRSNGSERYALSRDSKSVRLSYFSSQVKNVELAKFSIPEPKDGEVFTMEFCAVGRALIGKLDGKEVIRVEDDRLSRGGASIYSYPKGGIRKIEVLNLDGTAATAVAPSPALQSSPSPFASAGVRQSASAGEAWVRKWNEPEEHDANSPLTVVNGWVLRRSGVAGGTRTMPVQWRDSAIRAECQWVAGAPNGSLAVRKSGEKGSTEKYVLSRRRNVVELTYVNLNEESVVLKDHPVSEPSVGDTYTLELRAIGRTLIAKLDGREIIRVEDDKLTTGGLNITCHEKGGMRNIEVLNLDGTAAAAVTPSPTLQISTSSITPTAATKQASTDEAWVRMWNRPEDHIQHDWLTVVDGWVRRKSGLGANSGTRSMPVQWRDAAIRAEIQWAADNYNGSLWLRNGDRNKYTLTRTRSAVRLAYQSGPDEREVLKEFQVSEPKIGDTYALELRAVGRTLMAKLDGKEVIRVEDDKLTRGGPAIYVFDKGGMRNIEVLNLDKPAVSPSPSPEVPKSSPTPTTATKDAPFVNTLGMKFVPVPITGGPTGGQRVLFSVWETRVQDYEVFAKETKREWPTPEFEQGPTHPAVNVTWDDAQAFCTWLTERERKTGKLAVNERYRLPSDHEWSCAVELGGREDTATLPSDKKGKINQLFPWGSTWPPPKGAGNYAGEELQPALAAGKYNFVKGVIAGYDDGFMTTSPVESFEANRLGLHDMGGNVWQWCADWFDNDQKDRVVRGASWSYSDRSTLLLSYRYRNAPGYRFSYYGFRCVLAPSSPPAAK